MPTDLDAILAEIQLHLHKIGSANDAENHQYTEDAGRMRSEASVSLHLLIEQNPILKDFLPTLLTELNTGHIFGFGWSMLLDQINEFRITTKK